MSPSSSAYLRRLIRDRPCHRYPHQHRTRRVSFDIYAAGMLIDIVLVASYLISTPPHPHLHRTRRVLLDIQAAGILIDIVLVASYLISTSAASSSISFSSRHTRYPGRRHPHRHRTRRVLPDIHVGGILIDIVLVAPYSISRPPAPSSTSYSSPLT